MVCYSVRAYVLGRGDKNFWFCDYDCAYDFYYSMTDADYPVIHRYYRASTIKAAESRIKKTAIELRGFNYEEVC